MLTFLYFTFIIYPITYSSGYALSKTDYMLLYEKLYIICIYYGIRNSITDYIIKALFNFHINNANDMCEELVRTQSCIEFNLLLTKYKNTSSLPLNKIVKLLVKLLVINTEVDTNSIKREIRKIVLSNWVVSIFKLYMYYKIIALLNFLLLN